MKLKKNQTKIMWCLQFKNGELDAPEDYVFGVRSRTIYLYKNKKDCIKASFDFDDKEGAKPVKVELRLVRKK
jgi:hypothetical protein